VRALVAVAVVLAACHEKQELTAPPAPLRPEADEAPEQKTAPKDCEASNADTELKPLTFDERSIPEGSKLAQQAGVKLRTASSAEVDKPTREDYLTQAVDDFITALKADPYNVAATYGLAAAYAAPQINRKQCTINLLNRLLQMRPHPSKHAEVEAAFDKLLGRKQPLDPDFSQMRRDDRFRALIMKMCEGTNDANCVYGGQKDNRER
jgi:hypothetical protein